LEGSSLLGRGLSKAGAISLHNNIVTIPSNVTGVASLIAENTVYIAPNPFSSFATITLSDASKASNYKLVLYNELGAEVLNSIVSKPVSTLNTSNLHSGIYFYKVMDSGKLIQSGKLISCQ